MPFYLYEVRDNAEYVRRGDDTVPIAGKDGPIANCAKRQDLRKEPFWHIDEKALLKEIGGDPQNHALVVDLKPSDKETVSLYSIKDIWGYSYAEWTPLLLRLEVLRSDVKSANPEMDKKEFSVDVGSVKENVFEFLYLRGGSDEGTWTWGQVGRVNGALLWPKAMECFLGALREFFPQK